MTENEKRLKIIKMVMQSDSDGIIEIYNKLFGKSSNDITKEKMIHAASKALSDFVVENSEAIIIVPLFSSLLNDMIKYIFKEEK